MRQAYDYWQDQPDSFRFVLDGHRAERRQPRDPSNSEGRTQQREKAKREPARPRMTADPATAKGCTELLQQSQGTTAEPPLTPLTTHPPEEEATGGGTPRVTRLNPADSDASGAPPGVTNAVEGNRSPDPREEGRTSGIHGRSRFVAFTRPARPRQQRLDPTTAGEGRRDSEGEEPS